MRIENDFLRVETNPKGGSLTSIFDKKRNKELLYQPIPESWSGQDVFIFPMVARLKNGACTIDGKEYHMKNHGLIRYMRGEESVKDGCIHNVFESNDETLAQFPYSFKAESIYSLSGNELKVTYKVRNISDSDMPYMIGGHPAFMLDGERKEGEFAIDGNYLTFDQKVRLVRIAQEETCSFNTGEEDYGTVDRIDLSKGMFRHINTYIFKAEGFDSITLHKLDGSKITIKKNDISYLALWSGNEWGNFIAIEPWNGVPDYLDSDSEFKNKMGVSLLKPGEEAEFSYSVVVE